MSGSRSGRARFAIRNNSRGAYDLGAALEGAAKQVVAVPLHDLLNDRSVFAAQRAAFGVEAPVIAIDARGHVAGATVAKQWYTMAAPAQDVIAILNLEEVTSVHLVYCTV